MSWNPREREGNFMAEPNGRSSGSGGGVDPVLLLEMNEIPWRMVDLYRGDRRYPHIARFFSGSRNITTVTVDEGELSPWVTWPSFHRGLGSREHGVKNLGQDPRTFSGVPIWEEFRKRGQSIGVCGSMQSWPPKDPGPGGFYIPDTFAHDEQCVPRFVEPFQRFNLDQVRRNGRVIGKSAGFGSNMSRLLLSLPRLGIRPGTLWAIAAQLIGERMNPARRARRPIFQSILLWDIFRKVYDPRNPPAFATFFSNHVAGVMHRYWHHVFPGDFGSRYRDEKPVHRSTMDFAMALVDRILGVALKMAAANPRLSVVFASSMGQAAVLWENHEGIEASVPDVGALMTACGVPAASYKPLLAMVPQVAVEIPSAGARADLKSVLESAATVSGKGMFRVEEIGDSLSITIRTPSRADAQAGRFLLRRSPAAAPESLGWEAAGIRMNEVEAGTAYHIPEGVMAVYREGGIADDGRGEMKASEAKDFLMRLAGLNNGQGLPTAVRHDPAPVGHPG